MAKPPTKLKGIPVKGVRVDTKASASKGKTVIANADKAPPHVRQARARKRNKVTGAKAAK